MKTIVLIDGFNLYYGVIKNTAFKWLNIHSLFTEILHNQKPGSQLTQCRYYSAMVKSRLASRGSDATIAQQAYHTALSSPHTPQVAVILSRYQMEKVPLPRFVQGQQPDKKDSAMVWKVEEKQTDIKIALDAYRAAASGEYEQLVLCTNDSDLVPLLDAVKTDFPQITLGVITPRRKDSGRPAAAEFRRWADWHRQYILSEELERHQFADRIPTAKRPVYKPDYW